MVAPTSAVLRLGGKGGATGSAAPRTRSSPWGRRGWVGAGEVVLLSPACASFDQYLDFHARGDHFQDLVRALDG